MNVILDLLFPKICVGCGKLDIYFCQDCISNILQTDLVCPHCQRFSIGGQTHPICRKNFGLDGLWSLGLYQNPLRQALKQLKYGRVSALAASLADILLKYWAKYQPFVLDQIKIDRGRGWVVVPVPLFWWRANDRGFNQTSLIGQILSKKLGLVYYDCLKRIRYTKPQVRLTGQQRQQNIRNAFSFNSQFSIVNSQILLIDDVWTTGSTLKECCFILKRAGAQKVWAITLALAR